MPSSPIPFPGATPAGFELLDDKIEFDPRVHLAVTEPARTWTLTDLGYGREEAASSLSPVAFTDTFRILSEEGVRAVAQVVKQLRPFIVRNVGRIPSKLRGAVYRSRFVRDLCLSPLLTELMSDIFKVKMYPHTMPMHLGHMNFAPDDLSKQVDRWHVDIVPFDYVMMLTPLAHGGRTQIFIGTASEGRALLDRTGEIPEDRVLTPHIPPGHAIAQQGVHVLHRASRLEQPADRISFVNAYVTRDQAKDDVNSVRTLIGNDPDHIVLTEWARHKAWITRERLDELLLSLQYTDDSRCIVGQLRHAVAELDRGIVDLEEIAAAQAPSAARRAEVEG